MTESKLPGSPAPEDKFWFVTGCSTGFGLELVRALLRHGRKVVITARNTADLSEFAAVDKAQALIVGLDVTHAQQRTAAVESALNHFGRVDVLVNNAGIGYFAAIEESEDAEIRRMFEINVFALADLTKDLLPSMRKQRSGHIVNVSSIGGLTSFPAVGYYNATKFAVVGLSEALAKEVSPLGIRVTIVEPSGFRTDWAGRSANESPVEIEDYAETAGKNRRALRANSGRQAGDPVRAAEAIIKAIDSPHPPLHLLLGKAAVKNARLKLEQLGQIIDEWQELSEGADFPEAEQLAASNR